MKHPHQTALMRRRIRSEEDEINSLFCYQQKYLISVFCESYLESSSNQQNHQFVLAFNVQASTSSLWRRRSHKPNNWKEICELIEFPSFFTWGRRVGSLFL